MWKKKIKNYGKANAESKIAIKKDAIQSSNISIRLYEDKQENLQEKLKKLNEKERNLVMKWKKKGDAKGTKGKNVEFKGKNNPWKMV